MVDRIVHLRVLDHLRANQFSTADQVSKGTGLDLEVVKEALTELYAQKKVKMTEA